jgi:hypothetical protein
MLCPCMGVLSLHSSADANTRTYETAVLLDKELPSELPYNGVHRLWLKAMLGYFFSSS